MIFRYLMTILLLTTANIAAAAGKSLVPEQRDPSLAYVLVEVRNFDPKILGGNTVPGGVQLARYDSEKPDIRNASRELPTSPPKADAVRVATVGRPLIKEKGRRLYLLTITPDVWVIEGAQGTSFSLGSWSFRLEAGHVYDLGVFEPVADWRPGEEQGMGLGSVMSMALLGPLFAKRPDPTPAFVKWHTRTPADMSLPVVMSNWPVEPVKFAGGARFGNYLGGLVNRIDGRGGRQRPSPESPHASIQAQTE